MHGCVCAPAAPQDELASHAQRAASKIDLQERELHVLKERIRWAGGRGRASPAGVISVHCGAGGERAQRRGRRGSASTGAAQAVCWRSADRGAFLPYPLHCAQGDGGAGSAERRRDPDAEAARACAAAGAQRLRGVGGASAPGGRQSAGALDMPFTTRERYVYQCGVGGEGCASLCA